MLNNQAFYIFPGKYFTSWKYFLVRGATYHLTFEHHTIILYLNINIKSKKSQKAHISFEHSTIFKYQHIKSKKTKNTRKDQKHIAFEPNDENIQTDILYRQLNTTLFHLHHLVRHPYLVLGSSVASLVCSYYIFFFVER